MPSLSMTARWLETIQPDPKRRIDYFDSRVHGLVLRVSPNNFKTWCVLYHSAGKSGKQRFTLGRFPHVDLAEARKRALTILMAAGKGGDPSEERRRSKEAPTFKELTEQYLEHHAAGLRSKAEQERIVKVELLPAWGSRKTAEISRRDVMLLHDQITARGAPIAANRAVQLTRRIFNWAFDRELVEHNPALRVRRHKETPRYTVLTEQQIRAFWFGLDTAPMDNETRQALKLILVTAQRPGEVTGAAWEEFDLEAGWWVIPAQRAKNGRPHRVPLSALAKQTLAKLPRKTKFVFPSPFPSIEGDRPMMRHAVTRAMARMRDAAGLKGLTPHDLRRTAASLMAEAGVARLVISKLLNHTDAAVTAIYDRYSYEKEKRAAMEEWGRNLQTILHKRDDKPKKAGFLRLVT